MCEKETIQVWDPLVRLFHWSLVLCVVTAWVTQEDGMRLHVVAGCLAMGLFLFRFAWGWIGPDHARFRDFVRRPRQVWHYLQTVMVGHPVRYLGHNPAGGVMVLLLLAMTVGTAISGMVLYGMGEFSGPLAIFGLIWGAQAVVWVKKGHALLANGLLFLVALHLMGVVLTSWQHRENLIQSMLTGEKSV